MRSAERSKKQGSAHCLGAPLPLPPPWVQLLAKAYPYMARRLLTDPAPELRCACCAAPPALNPKSPKKYPAPELRCACAFRRPSLAARLLCHSQHATVRTGGYGANGAAVKQHEIRRGFFEGLVLLDSVFE